MNSVYDEYMKSVLGYQPVEYIDTTYNYSDIMNENIEDYYPEIYRIVYPMVQNICLRNTKPINKQLIESMTEEIYFSIEDEEHDEEENENRQRRIRNQGLNDLIRILLIRELFRKPNFPPRPRPPFPGPRPPRPRPGMGMYNRTLFNNFNENYDIYE